MQYRLLMVDDDGELLKMLKNYFTMKGYLVETARDGAEALQKISAGPDLILLDVNMPRMDGMEVCRRIRDIVACPILFLTARVEEQDRIDGLLMGGDDYIMKPFSLKELEARIAAHIKREERSHRKTEVKYAEGLAIDYQARKVFWQGGETELTRSEYGILEFLSRNPGQLFDKERIYESVFGYDAQGDSRVVTELIRRIRSKIPRDGAQEWIETVWGSGYRWRK